MRVRTIVIAAVAVAAVAVATGSYTMKTRTEIPARKAILLRLVRMKDAEVDRITVVWPEVRPNPVEVTSLSEIGRIMRELRQIKVNQSETAVPSNDRKDKVIVWLRGGGCVPLDLISLNREEIISPALRSKGLGSTIGGIVKK